MNKNRIKQLAEECTTIEYGADNGFDKSTVDLDKFAELIIKECVIQLDANRVAVFDASKHHEHWNCGVKWAIAKLQNHFSSKLKYIDCGTLK